MPSIQLCRARGPHNAQWVREGREQAPRGEGVLVTPASEAGIFSEPWESPARLCRSGPVSPLHCLCSVLPFPESWGSSGPTLVPLSPHVSFGPTAPEVTPAKDFHSSLTLTSAPSPGSYTRFHGRTSTWMVHEHLEFNTSHLNSLPFLSNLFFVLTCPFFAAGTPAILSSTEESYPKPSNGEQFSSPGCTCCAPFTCSPQTLTPLPLPTHLHSAGPRPPGREHHAPVPFCLGTALLFSQRAWPGPKVTSPGYRLGMGQLRISGQGDRREFWGLQRRKHPDLQRERPGSKPPSPE